MACLASAASARIFLMPSPRFATSAFELFSGSTPHCVSVGRTRGKSSNPSGATVGSTCMIVNSAR